MIVERYSSEQQNLWDAFVAQSRNAPFLFRRAYMDYHHDRFDDHSLIIRTDDGSVAAVLPAHRSETTLASHSGLTYGGFVAGSEMKVAKMVEVFASTIAFLQSHGFIELIYKTVPYIYHKAPCEEDRYALFLCSAERHFSTPTVVVPRDHRLEYQERRKRGVNKARKHQVEIHESDKFVDYWNILEENLASTHRARPVHSLNEILMLKQRCPANIRLFSAFDQGNMIAGVLIYESERVAHTQYIASNARGREVGALDLLFHVLLTDYYSQKPYFDFGTSAEARGKVNAGLIEQKEGFGARAVIQDWYRVNLSRVSASDLRAALV